MERSEATGIADAEHKIAVLMFEISTMSSTHTGLTESAGGGRVEAEQSQMGLWPRMLPFPIASERGTGELTHHVQGREHGASARAGTQDSGYSTCRCGRRALPRNELQQRSEYSWMPSAVHRIHE